MGTREVRAPMRFLPELFARNREWAAARIAADPRYFARLCEIQRPDHLWIGCSDSRVPANQIVGLAPGELFVHRNVANVFDPADLNAAAVLEYAVEALGVRHVIVCGHYRCVGTKAALERSAAGTVGRWLRPVEDLATENAPALAQLPTPDLRWARLCELNVVAQVGNVASSPTVQEAWKRGRPLAVHGWIYDLSDGLLRDLGVTVGNVGPA